MENNPAPPYLKVRDHSVSGEEFTLTFDQQYQMLVTSPKPGADQLGKYYESQDYVSHTDSKQTLVEKLYAKVKRFTLGRKASMLKSLKPMRGLLLDIGAGTGDFLLKMKEEGWQTLGVEPHEGARKLALGKGVDILAQTSAIQNGSVDMITMWHVLEHVPDVHEQLKDIDRMLASDGVLVIAVPNYRSYDAKYYGSYWAAYDVPRHLSHFSKDSILKLAAVHSFKVTEIKPMLFDSFYVSMLSEKYKTGTTNFAKAFFIGLLSNLKALRSKQYSSLIYVLSRART